MHEVRASMAGSIWKILLNEGEDVEAGEEVIILESMKMEIPIQSEVKGKIESILLNEGDFVNDGDVILTVKTS